MRLFSMLLLLLLNTSLFGSDPLLYVIEIKGEINASSFKKLTKGIAEAKELDAKGIIIQLNTYGGAVDAADSMRSALLDLKIPTAVFIDNQAVSAGALISIACDSIYMKKGGTIGAATVVNQTGTPMPDKYQSFMRAMMRSTAEVKGRNPSIAEAMVDPTIYIEGVIDSTKVLSLTAEEAINLDYCEGVASSLDEVAEMFLQSPGFSIQKQHLTLLDRILLFFLSPVIQGLLLMVIMGGIYFELQSPGIGFPSAAAIVAAVLYFSPLYLEGMAENWEIIVFVLGVLLLFAEIFVIPGFGIAGIGGILLMITGLTFAMIDNQLFYYDGNFDFRVVVKPISIVLLTAFLSFVGSIFLAGRLLGNNSLPRISLNTVLKESDGFVSADSAIRKLVGKTATVCTAMRPSGKIEVEGVWYEATMSLGQAERGDHVVIVKFEGGRFYCEHLPQ